MSVAVRREVTGLSMYDGAAVGVELGPSAYPSFPILPSLSPYLPTLPPSLRHSCGSEVVVEILDWVVSVRFTPTPTSLPKRVICVQCAAERR